MADAQQQQQQAVAQQIPVNASKITNQIISIMCIIDASLMVFVCFLVVRGDASMKMVALTACIGLANNVMGVAGTLLVGQAQMKMISAAAAPSKTTPNSNDE